MVVDTSALLAVVYRESDHELLEQAIGQESTRLLSAASALEASIVMARRVGPAGAHRDAYLRYGKGMDVAGLNYGDCFSYALAKDSGEPLLFKGDDFAQTDITPCL